MKKFGHVFSLRTHKSFSDGHLWFSIVTKQPHSHFTRSERLTCVLSVLFSTMLANILLFVFEKTSEEQIASEEPLIKIGSLRITAFALIIGIIGALITVPVNLIIVALFSNRHHRTPKGSDENTTDKYLSRSMKPFCTEEVEKEEELEAEEYVFKLF